MEKLISYNPLNDFRVFNSAEFTSDSGYKLKISAGTVAGRKISTDPQKPNEDAFSVIEQNGMVIAAVFDGTSSLKPIAALEDQTGARFASHFLKEQFEKGIHGSSPKEILRNLNKVLLAATLGFDGTSLDDTHTLPASTATIVQIDFIAKQVNISHVGDSFCIIYDKNENPRFVTIDKNREHDTTTLDLAKKVSEEKGISPREARQEEVVKQALLAKYQETHNRPDGTGQGVLNGDPAAVQYFQDISLPLDSISTILIASDGLIPPNLDEQDSSDEKEMLAIFKRGGLEEVIRVKEELQDSDPDFYKYLRYKHSDDATGIVIELL